VCTLVFPAVVCPWILRLTAARLNVCSTSGSHDGSLYAYGLSVGGSDWVTIRIRDVATGETLPDVVPWVKFSNITWTLDNKGFFYSRYPAVEGVGVGGDASKHAGTEVNKNEYHMLYYHVVGTPAESDVCVFEDNSQPLWNVGCELSHNGNVLLISVSGVGGAALGCIGFLIVVCVRMCVLRDSMGATHAISCTTCAWTTHSPSF
jgi:protease II